MSIKETAEKYVREKCPELLELSFGCAVGNSKNYPLVYVGYNNAQHALSLSKDGEKAMLFVDKVKPEEIIGHPIQLHHWLRVLREILDESRWYLKSDGRVMWTDYGVDFEKMKFSLTTGQPATEEDYQQFCNLVGI